MAQLLVCRSLAAILISGSEQESVLVQGPQMQPFACGEKREVRGRVLCIEAITLHTWEQRILHAQWAAIKVSLSLSVWHPVATRDSCGDGMMQLQSFKTTTTPHITRGTNGSCMKFTYSQMNEKTRCCLFWILLMMCGSFVFHVKYSPTEQQWDASGMAKLPSLQGTILTICSSFCARGIH